MGDIDMYFVHSKIEELEAAGKLYNDGTHMAYLRGATSYLKARVYAVLGEKEKAVEVKAGAPVGLDETLQALASIYGIMKQEIQEYVLKWKFKS